MFLRPAMEAELARQFAEFCKRQKSPRSPLMGFHLPTGSPATPASGGPSEWDGLSGSGFEVSSSSGRPSSEPAKSR